MSTIPKFQTGFPTRFPMGAPQEALIAAAAADALPVGTAAVFVTRAGVDAMTLALPKAGVYPALPGTYSSAGEPNDDGAVLIVVCTTAFAHTITTPANGVKGTLHIITFAAAVGNFVTLIAYNGTWWPLAQLGATIT